MKKQEPVTVLIPSMLDNEHLLGCLFSAVNQATPPLRIILGDKSAEGLDKCYALKRFCRIFRIDVLKLERGTTLGTSFLSLLEQVKPNQLVWILNDDTWAEHSCLKRLLKTMYKYNKTHAVCGAKVEVTRKNAFGGKDWNLSGDAVRPQKIPWCDTANLLIRAKHLKKGLDDFYAKQDKKNLPTNFAGDDIAATAKFSEEFLCVSNNKAKVFHIPLTEERWTDLEESDKTTLEYLEQSGMNMRWLLRSLEQSEW